MTKRGWWRRNVVALVALAVLLPATVMATGYNEWNDYFSGFPSQPIAVTATEEITFAGEQWGPAQITLVDVDDPRASGVPDDARLMVATIQLPAGVLCLPPALHETSGLGREWSESHQRELDWRTSDGANNYCSLTLPSQLLETPFVVPEDARGPFWLDLTIPGQEPRFLRFAVGE